MASYGHDTLGFSVNRALAEYNRVGTFGQSWSVAKAGRQLNRLGDKPDLGTTSALVWDLEGVSTEVLLKPADGNLIDTVSSSSTSDVGHAFQVSGSFFGVDGGLVRSTEIVTSNGQNKVTLAQPLARVSEVLELDVDPLVGDIYVYQDTAVSGGTPTDMTKVASYVKGTIGSSRSQKCADFTARDESVVVVGGTLSVNKKQAAIATFTLQWRNITSDTWRLASGQLTLNTNGQSLYHLAPSVVGVIPPNSDMRVVCESSATATPVSAVLMGYYAELKH